MREVVAAFGEGPFFGGWLEAHFQFLSGLAKQAPKLVVYHKMIFQQSVKPQRAKGQPKGLA